MICPYPVWKGKSKGNLKSVEGKRDVMKEVCVSESRF